MKNTLDSLRTWAEIDLDAIENNFKIARNRLPDSMKLLAVIKANAYGHGAVRVAKLLSGKADAFAVAATDEALELRHAGIKEPILLLGHIPYADFPLIVKYDIIPAVSDTAEASVLSSEAVKQGKTASLHLVADTGMSRIGFAPKTSSIEEIKEIAAMPSLKIRGMFSHLSMADITDKTYTLKQINCFEDFTSRIIKAGVSLPIRHIFNSAAIIDLEPKYDMAREGIILYGLHPSNEVNLASVPALKPAMSLKTHIVQVKMLGAGIPVSYGGIFVTERDTRIATVGAGYADGVPRLVSGNGKVLVEGKEVPILGRVCMDQFMIDVTDHPNAGIGDTVTIFGKDGDALLSADEVAESIGTIGYELVCGIAPRVPRVYIKDGEIESISRMLPHE